MTQHALLGAQAMIVMRCLRTAVMATEGTQDEHGRAVKSLHDKRMSCADFAAVTNKLSERVQGQKCEPYT